MSKKNIPVTDGDEKELNNQAEANEKKAEQEQKEENVKNKEEVGKEGEEQEETTQEEATEDAPKAEEKKTTKSPEEELSEMKDKYLRLYAEFDNYRKRTIKQRKDMIKLAAQDMARAILPAVDDFERAIRVADAEDNDETVPEGIRLVYGKMLKALEQQGVKPMETTGEEFDPELHEALTKVPAPSDDMKGKIIDTVERGYYLNDKIIRYPKVVVGQ